MRYFCDECGMDLSLNGCICDPDYKENNKMKKVVVVKYVDNLLRVTVVDAPKEDLLTFMYEQIGCNLVQVVYFDGYDAWVNEEGLYESGLPVYGYAVENQPRVQLAGNIIFTKGCDEEGNTTFFDEDEDQDTILKIMGLVSDARYIGEIR